MSSKKIYKIGIVILENSSYIDINQDIQGLLPTIWKYIKKKLEYKYTFKEILIKDIHWELSLQKIVDKEYDLIIGSYWIIPRRLKMINFTKEILIDKPVIVYDDSLENRIIVHKYIKNIFKIWIKPIILIIFFSILFSISYAIYHKKKDHFKTFVLVTFGTLGNRNNFILKKAHIYHQMIILVLSYFVILFVLSYTIQETVRSKKEFKLIHNDISGMTFYVQNGSHAVEVIKELGGKVIQVLNPSRAYSDNKFKKKVDGYVFSDINMDRLKLEGISEINTADIMKNWFPCGFPIHKDNKELLYDINNVIEDIKIKGYIYKSCQNIVGNSSVITC